MLLLLINAAWLLILLLVVSLCIATRDGDLQQNRPTAPAVPGRAHAPERCGRGHASHARLHTTPDHAQPGVAETAA